MIGYLRGEPLVIGRELCLVSGGVGYRVAVPDSVLATARNDHTLALFISAQWRQNSLELYGFDSIGERQLFEQLLSVSGVGPKMALVLVGQGAEQLVAAVQQAQLSFFTAVPRVGKKMAQKIIIELRDKLGEAKVLNLGALSPQAEQVRSALLALGFSDHDTAKALEEVAVAELDIESAIKQSIKVLTHQ